MQLNPPLQRKAAAGWFFVKAGTALSYPAVVRQELIPLFHFLQNQLSVFLRLRHKGSFSFPLITWTRQDSVVSPVHHVNRGKGYNRGGELTCLFVGTR